MRAWPRVTPRFAAGLRSLLQTLLLDATGLAGVALCTYGVWLIYQPAGFITAGLFALTAAIFLTRGA